jgi:predicted phosphohydrolase
MLDHIDLVLLADTHELHREIDIPRGDILIHAGDFTMFSKSLDAIEDFNDWLGELPHPYKLIVPGNHEFFLEADPQRRRLLSNGTLLINEAIEIDGLRLWGSPVTPLYGGAFGLSSPADRSRHWSNMPATDVLITHGPPLGVLDRSPGQEHMGDPELLEAVQRIAPMLHVFGHVHGAAGQVTVGDTQFVNAALLGWDGSMRNPVSFRMRRAAPSIRQKCLAPRSSAKVRLDDQS